MSINTPVIYRPYTSIRLKLLEACQLRCRFCHHEGNGAVRLVDTNTVVQSAIQIRDVLGLKKVHLTGGEPTLYPHLFELIERLASHGFEVAVTSHGLFSDEKCGRLHHLLKSGALTYINFSLHTLDPEQFLVINRREVNEANRVNADESIRQITSNISQLSRVGTVNINCVVAQEENSLYQVFEFSRSKQIALRLVPDWTALTAAHRTIDHFLTTTQARFLSFVVVYPTSNYSARYQIDDTNLDVKLIRLMTLKNMCTGCSFIQNCVEYFGNVRLEGNPLHVRLCIHQQGYPYVMPLERFLDSELSRELRHLLTNPPEASFSQNLFISGLREPFVLARS